MTKLTYKQSGVDYSKIDPLKIQAQKQAKATARNLVGTGFVELEESRGESAYVVDAGDFYLASITECLGTKALVADDVRKLTGKTYYDQIAQDTVAMAVNDLITVGATPLSIHAYWAAGGSDWFDDIFRLFAYGEYALASTFTAAGSVDFYRGGFMAIGDKRALQGCPLYAAISYSALVIRFAGGLWF